MANTTCPTGCGRPTSDGALCRLCAADLERLLAEVPWMADQLDMAVARLTSYSERAESKAAETPVVFDPIASEAASALKATLVSWARLVLEERYADTPTWPLHSRCLHPACQHARRARGPVADTTAAVGVWLLGELHWLRVHPAAGELLAELDQRMRAARRVVDLPWARLTFLLGEACLGELDGLPCPGELRALLPQDGPWVLRCTVCTAEHPPPWWALARRIMARRQGRPPQNVPQEAREGTVEPLTGSVGCPATPRDVFVAQIGASA